MHGNKEGFTLLEVLLVMILIAIFSAVIVPNLRRVSPRKQREFFVTHLNGLVRFAWQQALATRILHRIFVDFEKKEIQVQQLKKGTRDTYEAIKGAPIKTWLTIPASYTFKQFFIEGVDELSRYAGGAGSTWFFIVPDGIVQEVVINAIDTASPQRQRQFGLILNPFRAQFTLYDQFQKP